VRQCQQTSAAAPQAIDADWKTTQDQLKVFRVESTINTELNGWYSFMAPNTWERAADGGNKWYRLLRNGTQWTLSEKATQIAWFTNSDLGARSASIFAKNGNVTITGRVRTSQANGISAGANKLGMKLAASLTTSNTFAKQKSPSNAVVILPDVWAMEMQVQRPPWFLTTSGIPHVGGPFIPNAPMYVLYTYDANSKEVKYLYESDTGSSGWKAVDSSVATEITISRIS
jgi:hypothetical protein